MNRLYRKSGLRFAILWIFIYIAGTSLGEALSEITGLFKLFPALCHTAMAGFLLVWLKRNGLFETYGLFLPRYRLASAWFFLPLLLIALFPVFFSPATRHSPLENTLFIISMLCVGILEELIFRGFLFRAIEKDSVTFGIGHIVNLFSGQDLATTLVQILFATGVGFTLVILFHKGGSLIPCIIFHSLNNAFSVFANEKAQAQALSGKTAALILPAAAALILMIVYSIRIWRHLNKS